MHNIFGTKEDVEYYDREGAYLIPFNGRKIGVVLTPKGYFFLGGGLENGESHQECIERECLEEAGCRPHIEARICSAETYTKHPTLGYFHPIQTYYIGALSEVVSTPSEADHTLCWVEYEDLKGKMFPKMQNWALEQISDYLK